MGKITRRVMMMGAVAGAGAAAFAFWPAPRLAFDTQGVPEGFRRLADQGGGVTVALTGVSVLPRQDPLSAADLCALTFKGADTGAGVLAIAVFSDYFCPYCRVLDAEVEEIAAKDSRIALVRHEVPLLGRPSQMAARAAIAAARQGVGAPFRRRLLRTSFVPNPAYLRGIAEEEGLDPEMLIEDLDHPETDDVLTQSRRVFRAFGFPGTPGLVVGRTLVAGVISPRALRALIALELEGRGPCS